LRFDPNDEIVDVYPGRNGDDRERNQDSQYDQSNELLPDSDPHLGEATRGSTARLYVFLLVPCVRAGTASSPSVAIEYSSNQA
jgi:hypothetical protein